MDWRDSKHTLSESPWIIYKQVVDPSKPSECLAELQCAQLQTTRLNFVQEASPFRWMFHVEQRCSIARIARSIGFLPDYQG